VETASDQELVQRLQSGDLEALGHLYDRHRRLVYRTALAISGDKESAADLLQDVFLRLNRFIDNVDPSRPLEPWLYRMTANLSYNWVKRRKRWLRPLEDLADFLVGPGRNNPHEMVEKNDEWEQVQKAVSALPLPQRIVVVMYYLNDLSVQEIAEFLDIPEGTVKSRLHYGRNALKKNMGLQEEIVSGLNYERP
jgi:RNA polymerase sigma-70 factor (ECF subfamily)